MLTTHISLVALLLVGIFCGGADAKKRTSSAYTIEVEQKHQRPRGYSRTLADFKDISFSGDLAPIIALAEELAKEEEEEDNSGGGDNSGGNVTAETSIGCADDYSTEESFITFMYEIETVTDPTQVDGRDLIEAQDVQLSVERALNDVLANALLECPTMRRRRSLVDGAKEQIGIVEFDYWPTDEPISDDRTLLTALRTEFHVVRLSYQLSLLSLHCSYLFSTERPGQHMPNARRRHDGFLQVWLGRHGN